MTTTMNRCTEQVCRDEMRHEFCVGCSKPTCSKTIRLDENLRRTYVFLCSDCDRNVDEEQTSRQRDRALRDFEFCTDDEGDVKIRLNEMPMQIPSYVRAVLRAFWRSDATHAVVEDTSAGTLNQAIQVLGFHKDMYAETRSSEAVLRRIASV